MTNHFQALDKAIRDRDWTGIQGAVTTLINDAQLDVWYDYQPLLDFITKEGFECYTCALKAHTVLPEKFLCFRNYGRQLGSTMRKQKCGRKKGGTDDAVC